jgi:2-oxoisovalerate dehydrogenase E1 component
VLFCENNGYSEFSRTEDQHPVPLRRRADGYGLRYIGVDGNDVESVTLGAAEALRAARAGEGAVFVEAITRRTRGHYEGDQQRYRRDEALAVDPIERCEERLREEGVDEQAIRSIRDEVAAEIEDAVAFARAAPEPDPATFMDDVAPRPSEGDAEPAVPGAETTRYSRAVAQALGDALEDDASVFLAGIDVASGNVFGLTRGLAERFPGRVLDTPILESAIVGLAVGSAMRGLRPVVEIMYLDFIGVCLDQLLNQAAKLRFMTGGAVSVPMVVRTQFGSGRSSGAQHSQSLEALLAHIPGLSVVMPATAADAYGLLRSAIDYDGPVVVIENRLLYEKSGPAPERGHRVPLGRARVVREGADVTVVAWSRMVHEAMDAAARLAERGIDAEVIDLRSIVPLDRATVLRSVAKTNRLVIAHDAVTDFGVGAELAALAAYDGFWTLDAPVERVGAPYSPAPYSPVLEREWIPGADDIERAALRVVVTDPREIPAARGEIPAAPTS